VVRSLRSDIMRPPLVLTGGPAAGKSTTGRLVAELRDRCAFIDVDDIRHLVVSGHLAPWEDNGGQQQQMLGVENVCALVRNFALGGIESVVADFVTASTASVYRTLGGVVLVRLQISLSEAEVRAATRPRHITEAEFRYLHQLDANATPAADAVLKVDGLDLAGQAAAIERLWAAASHEAPR
jgi:hypothetical protein